jgi:LysM repeat protein
MPERGTSPFARIFAVAGLIVAFLLVIVVIAGSSGDSGDDGDDGSTVTERSETTSKRETAEVQRAIETGVYEVQDGDTMTSIAESTGIDVDTLQSLNPDVDPQALIAGRKIKLR